MAAAVPPETTISATALTPKKKRRPAGTPDPDAEVVALSPRTLLESDRYVCEICNQGFQRDQNLQMHRRRHKVPWKLLKREPAVSGADIAAAAPPRKRVFVCPEPSCLHHDPRHALGDLVGIKKHFRRKHSSCRQWSCARCGKAYAVHSDYKAHLKTCGTRGHSCDCGRVFSRVETFIEHQEACAAERAAARSAGELLQPAVAAIGDGVFAAPARWPPVMPTLFGTPSPSPSPASGSAAELQLMPPGKLLRVEDEIRGAVITSGGVDGDGGAQLELGLTIGLAPPLSVDAEEMRLMARRQVELAEQELAKAKLVRQQAQAELGRAHALRERAAVHVGAAMQQFTCVACRQRFAAEASASASTSLASNVSSVVAATDDHRVVVDGDECHLTPVRYRCAAAGLLSL